MADPQALNETESAQYQRFPTNLTRMLLRTGGCVAAFLDLGLALRSTSLEVKHYEMVILRVASLESSAYERMQHIQPARQAGWSVLDIEAIERGEAELLDPASASLLTYVDDCSRNVRVSDQTFFAMRAYFSEAAIAEATLLVGFYMMTARFLESLSVDLDVSPSDILLTTES